MTKLDRISVDPKRMNGQPTIRNLRLTVRRVIELLALYRIGMNCVESTPSWRMKISSSHSSLQPPVLKTGWLNSRCETNP